MKNAKKTCKRNSRDLNRDWINNCHHDIYFLYISELQVVLQFFRVCILLVLLRLDYGHIFNKYWTLREVQRLLKGVAYYRAAFILVCVLSVRRSLEAPDILEEIQYMEYWKRKTNIMVK